MVDLLAMYGPKEQPAAEKKPADIQRPGGAAAAAAEEPRDKERLKKYADPQTVSFQVPAGESGAGAHTGYRGDVKDAGAADDDDDVIRGGTPRDGRTGKKGRGKRRTGYARSSSFADRLPELWGVDLFLILLTAAGLALIIANFSVLLEIIAVYFFKIITVVLVLAVIFGAIMLLFNRRGRRRFWF